MRLLQAFLKWLRKSSEADKAKAPAIAEALEQPDKSSQKPQSRAESRPRTARSTQSSQRTPPAPSVRGPGRAASPVPACATAPRPPAPSSRPPVGSISATPNSPAKPRRDVSLIEPEPARPPEPAVLPDEAGAAESTIDAHIGESLPAAIPPTAPVSGFGVIRRARTVVRVQVGLDFGTATTKVMYQRLGVAEPKITPVHFAHGLREYPSFCLPSLATFDRSGNLFLGDLAAKRLVGQAWSSGLSRFKMLIAGRQDEQYLDRACHDRFREHVHQVLGDEARCPPEALAATYLAYAMRVVRWHLARELGTSDLEIWFNICVPVDQREKNAVMSAFERVFAIAELLDRNGDGEATARAWLDRATEEWSAGFQPAAHNSDTCVFVVPEALAGASAYISSLQRESGLHALVDIGAGTTDVSIFQLRLGRKSGVSSTWYAARSIPMGAGHVESWVADTLERNGKSGAVTRELVLRALAGDSTLAIECGPVIREALRTIWHRTAKVWGEAYGHLSRESYWRGTAVRVFLAGGGGLIPAACDIFRDSWQRGWGPYPCTVLPEPDGFDRKSIGAPFARLCVAYGLTTPAPLMGRYVMPADAPNDTPPPLPHVEYGHDGDQLVPRHGWT
jgi:hypothetical protein